MRAKSKDGPSKWAGKPNWLLPMRLWRNIQLRNIETLGLDVEGAKTDQRLLLPAEIRDRTPGHLRHYPLPTEYGELKIIADLPIQNAAPGDGPPEGYYVARCRWKLAHKDTPRMKLYDQRVQLASREVKQIQGCKIDARKELAEIKQTAHIVRSTLLNTSADFDMAFGYIARAFNANEPLPSGERVDVRTLISAYKSFYNHIDKLGGPITSEMETEAEEVVFERAVEAARERIARTVRDSLAQKAPLTLLAEVTDGQAS